jgi:hypothetical protein
MPNELVPMPSKAEPVPSDDPRYMLVSKSLLVGFTPAEAVVQAGFQLPDYDPMSEDDNQKLTKADIVTINDIVCSPQVTSLTLSLTENKDESQAHALHTEEVRAYLKAVVNTPISLVGKDSPLCQSYEEVDTKFGTTVKVKMVDKLKALDMDNKLSGRYAPTEHNIGPSQSVIDMMNEARSNS